MENMENVEVEEQKQEQIQEIMQDQMQKKQEDMEKFRLEMPKKPKFETSKIILGLVLFVCFVFNCIIIYGWFFWERQESSSMLGVVNSPAVAVISWYLWKSKQENMIKLKRIYGSMYTAEYEQNQNYYNNFGSYYSPPYSGSSINNNYNNNISPFDNENGMG